MRKLRSSCMVSLAGNLALRIPSALPGAGIIVGPSGIQMGSGTLNSGVHIWVPSADLVPTLALSPPHSPALHIPHHPLLGQI